MSKSDRILAAVALVSVAIYALACRPAWHPSGKSIAFPFAIEVQTEAGDETISGIAVYDVTTGSVHRIYEEKGEGFLMGHVLWTDDGKAIIAAVPGEDEGNYRVLMINSETGQVEATTLIPDIDGAMVINPPVLGGDRMLWLGTFTKKGEKGGDGMGDFGGSYMRVDLADGSVSEAFTSTDSILGLYDFGKRGCYYVKKAEACEEARVSSVIVGRFDPSTGALKEMATLPAGSYAEYGCMTAEPAGSRFAILAGTESDEENVFLRIFDEKGTVLKDVAVDREVAKDIGALAWIGDSVWIAVNGEVEKEESSESALGFLIVGVDLGQTKFVPVFEGASDENALMLQPAVSPDGKTVAVTGLGAIGGEKRPTVLVLLNLAEPEKEPKYIPLPLKEGETLATEETSETTPEDTEAGSSDTKLEAEPAGQGK